MITIKDEVTRALAFRVQNVQYDQKGREKGAPRCWLKFISQKSVTQSIHAGR